MPVPPVPEGFHTITPYLMVKGAARLIDFLKQAFGAEETFRMNNDSGGIGHATLQIGDSKLMLADALEEPTSVMLYLYVPDADALYKRAIEAGAASIQEPTDQFFGDRNAAVRDAWGNQWWIATQVKQVSQEELAQAQSSG